MKRRLLIFMEYIVYLIYKAIYAICCFWHKVCSRMAEKHTELYNKIMCEYEKYENNK